MELNSVVLDFVVGIRYAMMKNSAKWWLLEYCTKR